MEKRFKRKNEMGITIIALVITIVLLILAGVTIATLTGDNGILTQAGKAKDSTEIASEKEIVEEASIIAERTSKTGKITVEEMQKAIDKVANGNTATAIDNGETIVVRKRALAVVEVWEELSVLLLRLMVKELR